MKANDNQSLFEVFKPGVLEGYTFWQKFVYWFKNVYWYHFRNQTLLAIFAIILISVFIGDMINRIDYDLKYIVSGDVTITDEQMQAIDDYIVSLVPDVNGNEKVEVGYQVLSTDGTENYDQVAVLADQKLSVTFADDDILLYIIDGTHMETYATDGAFEPLESYGIESDPRFCVDITDCKLFKQIDMPTPSGGWYIGAKVINEMRAQDEEIMRKYQVAFDIIEAFANQ